MGISIIVKKWGEVLLCCSSPSSLVYRNLFPLPPYSHLSVRVPLLLGAVWLLGMGWNGMAIPDDSFPFMCVFFKRVVMAIHIGNWVTILGRGYEWLTHHIHSIPFIYVYVLYDLYLYFEVTWPNLSKLIIAECAEFWRTIWAYCGREGPIWSSSE